MTAENLVVRRQGRGTYVAKHDEARILFQFFKLIPDSGERQFPDSRLLDIARRTDPKAAAVLNLKPREAVVQFDRVRLLGGEACVVERISLPAARFPGLETREVPNNLYELYASEFGVTIGRASEKLKAVAAPEREAKALGMPEGSPLLQIDRLAFGLDGQPVEWRVSLCRTDTIHYASDLR
jgi:GntR family transcriptional regulator